MHIDRVRRVASLVNWVVPGRKTLQVSNTLRLITALCASPSESWSTVTREQVMVSPDHLADDFLWDPVTDEYRKTCIVRLIYYLGVYFLLMAQNARVVCV